MQVAHCEICSCPNSMFDATLPWAPRDRADTVEPERRPERRKVSDEWVLRVLGQLRPATRGIGLAARLETRRILRDGARLETQSDRALINAAHDAVPHMLRRGLKGRPFERGVAAVREMTFRKLGLRHHPVQVTGGLGLARGNIVEMATGEGKTITTLLPAVLVALTGTPVHVVTVNAYLATRDHETLRPVFEAFGLTTAVITDETDHLERPALYAADVVFATQSDFAFDYLRDRIAMGAQRSSLSIMATRILGQNRPGSLGRIMTRGLGFAVVDEVDSILIDEAQTPLIITAESGSAGERLGEKALLALAQELKHGRDFRIDWKARAVRLLKPAEALIEGLRPPVPELVPRAARREGLMQALAAIHLYLRDEHYVVLEEDGVVIVDEFTGRVMPDRQWQKGLHQMIEVKEAVEASAERVTLAQITYQTFFSRYLWFAGMTGTASEVARELRLTHERSVMRVPTHRPVRRRQWATLAFGSDAARWAAVVDEVRRVTTQGRPALVGTRSVSASDEIAKHLRVSGFQPVVLNARHDGEEAEIIAHAGQAGAVTVATNMAGRGTDIPVPDAVEKKGGLHVILTEFHSSARIDRQLIGRAGRQGQRGSARAIVSLDDPLFTDFVPGRVRFLHWISAGRQGSLPGAWAEWLRRRAQSISERRGRRRRSDTVRRAERLEKALGFRPDDI